MAKVCAMVGRSTIIVALDQDVLVVEQCLCYRTVSEVWRDRQVRTDRGKVWPSQPHTCLTYLNDYEQDDHAKNEETYVASSCLSWGRAKMTFRR